MGELARRIAEFKTDLGIFGELGSECDLGPDLGRFGELGREKGLGELDELGMEGELLPRSIGAVTLCRVPVLPRELRLEL